MNLYGRKPRFEPYQEFRQPLQQRWRKAILERDGHRCRNCKANEKKAGQLDLAHITDAVAFARAAGVKEGVTFSYRWDNLYILCKDCHKASHRFKLNEDDQERRWQVSELEAELRRLRGWSSPFAVLPPSMVPERLRPRRSFHDVMRVSPLVPFPTYGRYAADGGLIYGDEEAPPAQGKLFD